MYLEKRKMMPATILDCYGKFDNEDNDQFMAAIESIQAEECQHLVVNLTSVYSLNQNTVDLLSFAHEFYAASGGRLALVSPHTAARRDLEQAEITKKIPTYRTVYDALHRQNAVVDKTALPPGQERAGDSYHSPNSPRAHDEEGEIPSEVAAAGVTNLKNSHGLDA